MTSKKQVEANRRNALKSTGPRTSTGKNNSRQNAFKHGLTSESIITFNEDADELEVLVGCVLDELRPGSQLEHEIAERIATIMWRMRRVPRIEAGLLLITEAENQLDAARIVDPNVKTGDLTFSKVFSEKFKSKILSGSENSLTEAARVFDLPQARLAEAFRRDADQADTLGRLSRYEGVLLRQLERSFELLHKLKMARIERTEAINKITDLSKNV